MKQQTNKSSARTDLISKREVAKKLKLLLEIDLFNTALMMLFGTVFFISSTTRCGGFMGILLTLIGWWELWWYYRKYKYLKTKYEV